MSRSEGPISWLIWLIQSIKAMNAALFNPVHFVENISPIKKCSIVDAFSHVLLRDLLTSTNYCVTSYSRP